MSQPEIAILDEEEVKNRNKEIIIQSASQEDDSDQNENDE